MNRQILGIFLAVLFLFPFLASAAIWLENPLKYDTIAELIESIAGLILWTAIAVAPVLILIGAYNIMTSVGDPAKVKKGRDFILYSAAGLAIILFARGIIALIRHTLGAE